LPTVVAGVAFRRAPGAGAMASPLPVDERSSLLQRSAEGVADKASRKGFAAFEAGPDWQAGDDGGGGGGRDAGAVTRSFTLFPLRGQSRERYFARRSQTGGGGLAPFGSGDGGVNGGGGGHGPSAHRRQRVARMAARLGLSAKAREKLDAQLEAAGQPEAAAGSGAVLVDGGSDARGDDYVRSVAGAGRDEVAEDVDERVAALLSSLAEEEESTARLLALSTAAVAAHIATAVVVYHVLEGWSWTDCVYFTVVSVRCGERASRCGECEGTRVEHVDGLWGYVLRRAVLRLACQKLTFPLAPVGSAPFLSRAWLVWCLYTCRTRPPLSIFSSSLWVLVI